MKKLLVVSFILLATVTAFAKCDIQTIRIRSRVETKVRIVEMGDGLYLDTEDCIDCSVRYRDSKGYECVVPEGGMAIDESGMIKVKAF